jgi:sulfofructose kinase
MQTSPQVIGLGHITCDIICPLQGWPEVDTKTIIPGLTLTGGGPTANAIAALARLGISCALAGKLGADVLGRYTVEAHIADGIDMSHVHVDAGAVSPVSVILSDLATGTRTILLTKGERTTLASEELDWEWLRGARVLHLDGHQLPASLALARAARDWPQTLTVFDAGSLREGMEELCGLCDYVIASQRFVRQLAGVAKPRRWLEALRHLGARRAGVTLGSAGCVLLLEGDYYEQPAYRVAVQDTTGAGDAFHGGFIYGLLKGAAPQECLQLASAVAALKCTGLGARAALPNAAELSRFLQAQP